MSKMELNVTSSRQTCTTHVDDGLDHQGLNVQLYRKVYLIRMAEEAICAHYFEDEMKTPMHMSMGGEAIAGGVCQALKRHDQVLGTYRSHGLYLAKTMESDCFFAELYGKETGTSRGKGGSMHLIAPDDGLVCTSAVVASTIPVAMGIAWSNKMQKNDRMTAVFFGDGAADAGVFWETVNFCGLNHLPLLFVCEDNRIAVHTARDQRQSFERIEQLTKQFGLLTYHCESTDARDIYDLTKYALTEMRRTGKPALMRLEYYRYLEHVGVNEDFDAGYRAKSEYEEWRQRDPITILRQRLVKDGVPEDVIENAEKEIREQVTRSVQLAKEAPFTNRSEVCVGVFGCE
jgi:pyruvate dehydrogenase E1 component alpha subunit